MGGSERSPTSCSSSGQCGGGSRGGLPPPSGNGAWTSPAISAAGGATKGCSVSRSAAAVSRSGRTAYRRIPAGNPDKSPRGFSGEPRQIPAGILRGTPTNPRGDSPGNPDKSPRGFSAYTVRRRYGTTTPLTARGCSGVRGAAHPSPRHRRGPGRRHRVPRSLPGHQRPRLGGRAQRLSRRARYAGWAASRPGAIGDRLSGFPDQARHRLERQVFPRLSRARSAPPLPPRAWRHPA